MNCQTSELEFRGSGLRRLARFEVLFCCLVFILIVNGHAQQSRPSVETGKLIVKLSPDAVPVFEQRLRSLSKTSDTSVLNIGIRSFDRINRRHKATAMRRVFPDAGSYEAKHRRYGLHLWYEITIPEGADPETVATSYGADSNVHIAEPRYRIRSFANPAPRRIAETPDDPEFNRQWNYQNTGQTGGTPGVDIRLTEAWQRIENEGIRNTSVVVAVMDGGIYYNHEDLRNNIWVNEAELNGRSRIDDDGNGYADDIYGYNFVDRTGGISYEDHATHVAGTIAAVTGNATGVAGIAGAAADGYGVRLMTVQILNGDRSVASIGGAFAYAADNGAVIAQNSWGYETPDTYNKSDVEAINYFINEAGRDSEGNPREGTPMVGGIVIFAAGNDGNALDWYPARFDNVIAVAATDHFGKIAYYSNFGHWVDISAPGGDTGSGLLDFDDIGGIYSTSYNYLTPNHYEYMQGTSMACPHVSGVAALILSVHGNECYTPAMLRSRLLQTATPLAAYDPENATVMGAGLVNAFEALAPPAMPQNVTDLNGQTINAVSCRLNFTVADADPASNVGLYTVACATEPLDDNNFNLYARDPVAATHIAENEMQITVSGLQPATHYYIAIRSADNPCISPPISNTIQLTTRANQPPVANRQLPAMIVRDIAADTAVYIGDIFTDADGDALTFSITSSSSRIARAKIAGNHIYIDPVAAGKTELKLTADDGNTGMAPVSLQLTVTRNNAPVFSGFTTDTVLIPGTEPATFPLLRHTSDPDGDEFTWAVQASTNGIVLMYITDGTLTVDPRWHGNVELYITATDAYGAQTVATLAITVEQKYAPDAAGKLLLYPNPASDLLWYSFILDEPAQSLIRVYNAAGQMMHQSAAADLEAGAHYYQINVGSWRAGIYIMQLTAGGKPVATQKFVKM